MRKGKVLKGKKEKNRRRDGKLCPRPSH